MMQLALFTAAAVASGIVNACMAGSRLLGATGALGGAAEGATAGWGGAVATGTGADGFKLAILSGAAASRIKSSVG